MLLNLPLYLGKTIIIYVLAAILPAIFLMRYIYKHDTVEKEPPKLLFSLLLAGVASALCSIVLELIGGEILNNNISRNSPYYVFALAFLVVAVVEEGTKMFFMKLRTWRDPNFSHLFDGVVYAAFVSLGFAAFENVKYVFTYGLTVAVTRAFSAVPAHLGFSVFMGVFYSRAKLCEKYGDSAGKRGNLIAAYVSAVMLHGIYDVCAMMGTTTSTLMFLAFIAVMYVVVHRLVKKSSAQDREI